MTTLTVGAGQQYQTIAAAISAAQDGDVVAVQAGTYVNDFAEITHKITLEGVGGLVDLVATSPIPNGKAIIVTDTDVTIDHFSFTGATVNDGNGAGIRYQGGDLTVTNSVFKDNQNGILGAADPNGSIVIKNSEFDHNGAGDGYTHGIYIGDVASLVIDNSYFHDAVVGHEIKSRAESTTITNSRIEDGDSGTASYTIDLPNGGLARLANDTIQKGVDSQNSVMISFGEEGNLHANSSLEISNSVLVYDETLSSSSALVRNSSAASASLVDSSYYGVPASQIFSGVGTTSRVVLLAARPALSDGSPIGPGTSATDNDQPSSPSSAPPSAPDILVDGPGSPNVSGPVVPIGNPAPNIPPTLELQSGRGNNAENSPDPSGLLPNSGDNSLSASVYRFFDSQTGTQFLTGSPTEMAALKTSRPDLVSEGAGFGSVTDRNEDTVEVFRFFDMTNGTHFYTSSTSESDQVQSTRADLIYEGSAFTEYGAPHTGAVPVYRFFDTVAGTHFYSDSASERATILSTRPDLAPEGIAFYAPSGS